MRITQPHFRRSLATHHDDKNKHLEKIGMKKEDFLSGDMKMNGMEEFS